MPNRPPAPLAIGSMPAHSWYTPICASLECSFQARGVQPVKWHRQEPAGRPWTATGLFVLVAAILIGCAAPAPTPSAASLVKSQAAASHTATPVRQAPAAAAAPKAGAKTPLAGSAGGTSQLPDGLVLATPGPGDRMPTIGHDQLPSQGRDVLALIARGGPFKHRQDGVVFENREGILLRKSSGYYHEYTVETPGSPDRGARRIIRGAQNETYSTDDHYASFKRVVQ
jgi:ribonuclease T1